MTGTAGEPQANSGEPAEDALNGQVDQQQKTGWKSAASKGRLVIALVIVCSVVAVTYWPVLSAKTLSTDDHQYFANNALVQNPGWASAKRFLTEVLEPSTVMGYYQPLTMISLMLDYALGGCEDNLLPFHCTSLILHVSNTALIIVLLYLLFGRIEAAAIAGLLFGVHPLTVEPVPWVSECKTLLAAFFSLWSLIFYVYPRVTGHKSRVTGFYIGSLVAYLLALMSKPTSIPLPAVMLLMDYWPLRRFSRRAIFEKVPFFVLGGIFAIITYISQSRTAGSLSPGEIGAEHILFILCHNIIFYLYKIVWPVNLSGFYVFPKPLDLSHPMVLAGVIGTGTLIPVLLISLRWTRAVLTGWLIFFVAIFPTIGVIGFTPVIACEKFVYLPSIGLLMALAAFLCRFLDSGETRRYLKRTLLTITIVVLTAAEIAGTRRYLEFWRDPVRFYKYMLSLTPECGSLYQGLGYSYNKLGCSSEAIKACEDAVRFDPDNPHAYNSLGFLYGQVGRYAEEIKVCKQALVIKPNYPDAYINLAYAYSKLDRYAEAIDACEQAIKLKPNLLPMAHNTLGCIYGEIGRWPDAVGEYKQAIIIKPDYADAYYNMGDAYRETGRYKEAIEAYKAALSIKPDYAEADYDLGIVYGKVGSWAEAAAAYKEDLKIKPNYAKAYCNLGVAYDELHRYMEAIEACERAVKIEPNDAMAHYDLGVIYLAADSNSAQQQYEILKKLDSRLADRLSKLISRKGIPQSKP